MRSLSATKSNKAPKLLEEPNLPCYITIQMICNACNTNNVNAIQLSSLASGEAISSTGKIRNILKIVM